MKKKFSQKKTLEIHLRIYTGEKSYLLQKQNINFKLYLRKHTEERPCKCSLCDQVFLQNINFKHYMRKHTRERPCNCRNCRKAFSQKYHLEIHLTIHIEEKAYISSHCDLAFCRIAFLSFIQGNA